MIYLQNQSPISQSTITVYKNLKSEKSYLSHFCILRCQVWIHIPQKKCKKFDDRSYQGIHVGYEAINQYQIYDLHSGRIFVKRDVYFDEAHCYDKGDHLNPKNFADNGWHKIDDELCADPINIINISKPVPEFTTIFQKSPKICPYFDELRSSLSFSEVPNSVGDKIHHEKDATPSNLLRKEIEKWPHLQLNQGDRNLSIQSSDTTLKRSFQDCLTNPTPGT